MEANTIRSNARDSSNHIQSSFSSPQDESSDGLESKAFIIAQSDVITANITPELEEKKRKIL